MDRLNLYDQTQEMLVCELEKITLKNELTPSSLEFLDKLVDIIKDLDEISMNEEERISDTNGNYSQRNMPRYYYGRGTSYRDGSYSRRNDSMMRDSGGYSRGNSKSEMLNHLFMAQETASNDEERKRIQRMIDELESK